MKKIRVIFFMLALCLLCREVTAQNLGGLDNLYMQELFIVSRSLCDPVVKSSISGKSESRNSDTVFHLSNGQVWKQYNLLNGHIIQRDSNFYKFTSLKDRPKVTISRDPYSILCKMRIEDTNTTLHVYRKFDNSPGNSR